jgi:hypothetical protein
VPIATRRFSTESHAIAAAGFVRSIVGEALRVKVRAREGGDMSARTHFQSVVRLAAAAAGVAAGVYGVYAATTWLRYGHPAAAAEEERDPLLDRFMPVCDVVERHAVRVEAPADVTLEAARHANLFEVPLVRAIVKGRELLLGAAGDARSRPRGLLAEVQALGSRRSRSRGSSRLPGRFAAIPTPMAGRSSAPKRARSRPTRSHVRGSAATGRSSRRASS